MKRFLLKNPNLKHSLRCWLLTSEDAKRAILESRSQIGMAEIHVDVCAEKLEVKYPVDWERVL
jgi:hypothetical protein